MTENGDGSSAGNEQVRSWKRKRAQVKAQCTRFGSYLEGMDFENTSVSELRQRLHKFRETWGTFSAVQTAIEEIEDSLEFAASHNEERNAFEEKYFSIAAEFETLIERKLAAQSLNLANVARGSREETPLTSTRGAVTEHLKLPRVNLPTFSGAFEEWIPFRNMFQSMIDSNTSLPEVQKMQYLLSALKGESRDVIASLEVSDENYVEAWEMLKERYDDSGWIIQRHIKALFEVPVITKENHLLIRRLLDDVLKHLRALKALKRPTDQWDDLMVYLVASRLDQKTSRAWEVTVKRGEVPTLRQLIDFLAQHSKALEASSRMLRSGTASNQDKTGIIKGTVANVSTASNKCAFCSKEGHAIYKCHEYLKLEFDKRIKGAKSRRLCLNCLRSTSHLAKQCTMGSCRKCNKRHNTVLHLEQASSKRSDAASGEASTNSQEKVVITIVGHASPARVDKQVLLATAIIKVMDSKGKAVLCRALLDGGSQSCFVTSSCVKALALKRYSANIPICGLGGMSTQTRKMARMSVKSRINSFQTDLNFLVVDCITQDLPTNRMQPGDVHIPKGIQLADPNFHETSKIDLLLGAEIFFELLCVGKIKLAPAQPIWQKTVFGWIVAGDLMIADNMSKGTICNLTTNDQLNQSLQRFWQLEGNERKDTRSPEERACEEHFARTYRRNDEGRFIVSLPIKEETLRKIGSSRDLAVRRFKNLEKRFERQPCLKEEYSKFMHEYIELGHMKEIRRDSVRLDYHPQFYLPHHCVIKDTSSTTKLRVIFDASSKTADGVSLNDALMTGPVLQEDILSILMRFRTFKYAITADIAKMYRQVLVDENQTALQRIVWRDDPTEEIRTYELMTLTYGTAPASFLATKVIYQIADLKEQQYPLEAKIARRDFYMDDLLSGANSKEEALAIRDQVTALLREGGFTLRKWASNDTDLLNELPGSTVDSVIRGFDKEVSTKTLGVEWDRINDVFQYSSKASCSIVCTKRMMLSSISQIFDPLGLLAPVIVSAKILIQEVWKLQLDWDESLPSDIYMKWRDYVADIQQLKNFSIQRHIMGDDYNAEVQLHGFCDASERAYAACVYLRSLDTNGAVQVHLLCAKTRVAPLKAVSIPRLELCGAQRLAQLIDRVKASLTVRIDRIYCWTDAAIVLHWIKATNKKLPVFVAHRVGEIQELTSVQDWNHVGTRSNPADLASRGSSAKELCSAPLWWNGPDWLKDQEQIDRRLKLEDQEEIQAVQLSEQVMLATTKQPELGLADRFSTLQKLIRVVAMCIRFTRLCKRSSNVKAAQSLTAEELDYARKCIIRAEQLSAFELELSALRKGKTVAINSSLRHLNPLLDDAGILRVGGRLKRANLSYDTKHPAVLPRRSKFAELIILHEHVRHGHAGVEATLAAVRKVYWPIGGRSVAKRLIRGCVRCFRYRPRATEPMMGDLPSCRVNLVRPFIDTGVDFCGPIYVREGKRRGAKRIKAYVAVFVCMAVKAVHLEVVSDLSTDAFLNAFKRFIGRRGRPANVYSDNGTNFIGANSELEKDRSVFHLEQSRKRIIDYAAPEGIRWHFIPPKAPHFGGLWESAVKSFKTHFHKMTTEAAMTFEEASTLVAQIEAILNSRPLTALSEDPNDFSYLSPGHFLIGSTLTSYPEPDIMDVKINRLSRWQMLERIKQHFWKRWSSEYLLTLQRRNKWISNAGPQLKIGQLVLCREDGLPPLKWMLGRVKEVMPGDDKIIRAAVIKTANGEYKRPATKLCVLPMEDDNDKRNDA